MSLISWMFIGPIVGVAAARLGGRFPLGIGPAAAAGLGGAFLGATVFEIATGRGAAGFDLGVLFMAIVGAALMVEVVDKLGIERPQSQDGGPSR